MNGLTRRVCSFSTVLVTISLIGATTSAEDTRFRLLAQADPSGANGSSATSPTEDQSSETRTAAIHEVPNEHPLLPAILLAQGSLTKMQTIGDYEATLVKQERLGGKLVTQSMQMRFRDKPFSVYLEYAGDQAGREIMFVQGRYGNQIQAHEGSGLKSLVGTVSLATDGVEAMQENRYPITMIGMRKMLETILTQWQEETKYGEVEVKFYPNAKLGARSCKVIETSHTQPRRQFKFHKTRLFIDSQTKLPVRVEQYGFPAMPGAKPPLEEEYTYSNIRTNVGLSDRDFNTENPDYNF